MHIIIKSAIAAMALATPAQSDRLSFMLGSNHVGAPDGMFNETNPGVFYTKENETFDVTVGIYHNSYSETSVSLTVDYGLIEWDGGELAVFGGMSYYGDYAELSPVNVAGFVPMGGLQIRHGNVWAQIIPLDGKPVDAVIAGGITFDFN